jgi:glucose/mannose transport system substrate-binding protein
MAVSAAAKGALQDVVSQFWNSESITNAQAMDRLVAAAKASK